jgi:hypothetical protein
MEWNCPLQTYLWRKKLKIVQNRDNLKKIIATKKDINLIVIPDLVSNDKILKKAFIEIAEIIKNLIKNAP